MKVMETHKLAKKLLPNESKKWHLIRFCIPIGSTVNMDGTALYEAAAALFIAQLYAKNFSLEQVRAIGKIQMKKKNQLSNLVMSRKNFR
jgi:Na+/H+-dicarboxylate symporter